MAYIYSLNVIFLSQYAFEIAAGDAGVGPDGIAFAFFALPGYGEISGDGAFLDEAPAAVLGHRRYRSARPRRTA